MGKKDKPETKKVEDKKTDKKDETIMYQPIKKFPKTKAVKKEKKEKKKKDKKGHKVLKKIILVMLVMFLLIAIIGGGVLGAIVYRCIWGDWAIDLEDLVIKYENTTMYDKNGEVIAVLTGDETREIISKEEMSPYLLKAFVAIEDERFEEHGGVDWKRTIGAFIAFIPELLGSNEDGDGPSYGGSTITQQLVKNFTDDRANNKFDGALRKIREIVRAYEVESMLSKDQILEMYLNLIPLGGTGTTICGVQMASRYYFDKNASEVTVAEAAYIAGITSAPSSYNPFGETDRKERIDKKIKTVLKKMKDLGKITEEEYNSGIEQVDKGMEFKKGNYSQNNKLSYYLEATRNAILKDLMAENSWSYDEAKMHLYGNGYNIYTNFDPAVQTEIDKQFVENASKWYNTVKTSRKDAEGNAITVQRQGAMVVIDNETGYIIAGAGGLGEKTEAYGTNRMDIKGHSPGSCMKPIGIVGPSLEEGIINLASTFDDTPRTFGSYAPKNWSSKEPWAGYMNMREILGRSWNIPEIMILQQLTVPKSLSYLSKMGVNVDAEADVGLSLALGGMTNGMTAVEMAGAYATVANGGVYRTPLYYTKIADNSGNIIYQPKQEETRVFSQQNAWLLQDLMKEPIYGSQGTGGAARISGQEVRGKTGTTNDNSSAWFCGYTRYYTASVWLGFDIEADGKTGNRNYNADSGVCARLWQSIMSKVHTGKETKSWDKPTGITTAVVCRTSGKLATEECRHDPEANKAYTEYFASGTVPSDYCGIHQKVAICNKTGKRASENCTDKSEKVFITRENADTNTSWRSASDAKYMAPVEVCEECKKAPDPVIDDVNDGEDGENNNTNKNTNSNINNVTNTNTNSNTNKNNNKNTNSNTNKNTNTSNANTNTTR